MHQHRAIQVRAPKLCTTAYVQSNIFDKLAKFPIVQWPKVHAEKLHFLEPESENKKPNYRLVLLHQVHDKISDPPSSVQVGLSCPRARCVNSKEHDEHGYPKMSLLKLIPYLTALWLSWQPML